MRVCMDKFCVLVAIAFVGASHAQVSMTASSEFQPALDELRKAFTTQWGIPTRVIYGSSGAMAEAAKAPGVDLFLSGAKPLADAIAASDRAEEGVYVIASAPVGTWVRGSKVQPDALLSHLSRENIGRIAIADTVLSPDGRAAVEAMHNLQAWPDIRKRLVVLANPQVVVDSLVAYKLEPSESSEPSDSVAATESDTAKQPPKRDSAHKDSSKKETKSRKQAKAPQALAPITDAFLPQPLLWNTPVAGQGRWVALDGAISPAMRPCLVPLKSVNPSRTEATRKFLQFLQSPKGRSILAARGFLPVPQ
ncbi:MAG: substrate-binding domain-containing protein [Fibrobacterota bacterium]|nr:substrate-binding domain-containing protein [Fibrobacterota bacterium]QQS05752.1 MAG: substrate-binding domain-containing protein [Fibrobacterota bacterium]